MENLKIAIVEDEFIVAEDIRETLLTQGYTVVGSFTRGEEAFKQIPLSLPDLLLVDITLQGAMTGIDLVERLNTKMNIPVIYITANSNDQTYVRAKSTNPVAFLVKPFNTPTLLAAIDLAFYNLEADEGVVDTTAFKGVIHNAVFIRTNGKFKKIPFGELLFIEADGSYLNLVTRQHKFKLARNLSDFQRKVNVDFFCRVHRSFIVNLEKVDSFDDAFVYIGEHKVPISKSTRGEFLSRLKTI